MNLESRRPPGGALVTPDTGRQPSLCTQLSFLRPRCLLSRLGGPGSNSAQAFSPTPPQARCRSTLWAPLGCVRERGSPAASWPGSSGGQAHLGPSSCLSGKGWLRSGGLLGMGGWWARPLLSLSDPRLCGHAGPGCIWGASRRWEVVGSTLERPGGSGRGRRPREGGPRPRSAPQLGSQPQPGNQTAEGVEIAPGVCRACG